MPSAGHLLASARKHGSFSLQWWHSGVALFLLFHHFMLFVLDIPRCSEAPIWRVEVQGEERRVRCSARWSTYSACNYSCRFHCNTAQAMQAGATDAGWDKRCAEHLVL